ncbi:hypothetical protein Dimus_013594 [Dionaea muscipula]
MARGRGTRGTLFDPNIGENMARGRGTRGKGGHTLPENNLPTSPLPPTTSHIPAVDSHVALVTLPAPAAASPVTPVTSPALADATASPVSPLTHASINSSNIASSCSSRLPVLLVEGSEIFSKELPNVANKVSGIIKKLEVSLSSTEVQEEEENNRPVALDEVDLNTHLKGGKFCSEKAKKVYDKFIELMEQQRSSDGEDGDEGSESSTC